MTFPSWPGPTHDCPDAVDRNIRGDTARPSHIVMAARWAPLSGLIRCSRGRVFHVMVGLVPTIHDFTRGSRNVDGWTRSDHDEMRRPASTVQKYSSSEPDSRDTWPT